MQQKHFILRPDHTGRTWSRIKTTMSNHEQSRMQILLYTCTSQWCSSFSPEVSPDCTRTAFPFLSNVIRMKINSKQTTKRQTGQKPRKRAKMKKKAWSSRKNLEGQPMCSLHKKCWFLMPANEIRMPSLIPRELSHTLQRQLTGLTCPIKSLSFGSVQNIPFLCNRWVIVWSTTTLYVPVIV